ncbi:hypothetical protein [Streptomyces prunicolor]|uniref:hypothetical protein n=1 Tax=Streptomyces prunicolor TaxID=67348 RepID=UPI00341DBB1C
MKASTASQQAQRSQQNMADFWNARQKAVSTEKELAGVMFDYARAVACKIAEDDPAHPIWRDLATLMSGWATQNQRHIP